MISPLAFRLIERGEHPWLFVTREDLIPCWICPDSGQREIVLKHLFAPLDLSQIKCRQNNPSCINPDHLYTKFEEGEL